MLAPSQLDANLLRENKPQLLLKSYVKLVHVLMHTLSDNYFVFYNNDPTLDALRFALLRKFKIDIGRHLLRNDGLRADSSVWYWSLFCFSSFKQLWTLLLRTPVPVDPVARARGFLQLFKQISATIAPPSLTNVAN